MIRPCLRWWIAPQFAHIALRAAQRGGTRNQTIGRSRGGPTTKIHALCGPLRRFYALMLMGGQVHDILGARGLLASVAIPARLLSDKAHDANDIRDYLAANGGGALIPSKSTRPEPKPHVVTAYKIRNIIALAFSRLKDKRGIATRYDKKAANFPAAACLAAAAIYWMQRVHP